MVSCLTSRPLPLMRTAVPSLTFFRALVEPSGFRSPASIRYCTASFAALVRAAFLEGKPLVMEPKGWSGREGMVTVQANARPRAYSL